MLKLIKCEFLKLKRKKFIPLIILDVYKRQAEYSRNDRTEFIHTVQETQVAQQSADISKKRWRLATAQKRAVELEKLIC